jgi:hypothetical protein
MKILIIEDDDVRLARLRLHLGSKPRTAGKGETTGDARAVRRAFDWQQRGRLR